jgi:hypothetical protein
MGTATFDTVEVVGTVENFERNRVEVFWVGNEMRAYIAEYMKPIYCLLGKIKRKNDGRFEYFVKRPSTNFYQTTPSLTQGVFLTKIEAKQELQKIWNVLPVSSTF